jgi:hypothetical protein
LLLEEKEKNIAILKVFIKTLLFPNTYALYLSLIYSFHYCIYLNLPYKHPRFLFLYTCLLYSLKSDLVVNNNLLPLTLKEETLF